MVLTWLLLGLAVLAWIFIPQARDAWVQFLWSYDLLWQFWFLSRSKTLSWTPYARLFAVGAWIVAPLSALTVSSSFEIADAYFAGLLEGLSDWWQGLDGWEKAGVIITAAVIDGILTLATGGSIWAGGFTALGAALTAQEAGAVVVAMAVDQILRRTPAGRWVDRVAELVKRRSQERFRVSGTKMRKAFFIASRIPAVKPPVLRFCVPLRGISHEHPRLLFLG
ncbi:MAG: hypothetical protein M0Z65_08790 [Firmicutes bacterium]|nr:hypothetical protein [Bacillota bacterium]